MALACLVRFRGSEWAAEQANRAARALNSYIRDDGSWDTADMQKRAHAGGIAIDKPPEPYGGTDGVALVGTHGRMIEALLEVFSASGDLDAFRLADRLARFHFDISTRPDGSVPEARYIHTHSLFGTYRGLLRFGELTGRHEYVERVATTYAASVRTAVRRSGFVSHDWGRDGRGETTSPGDAAQLALRLARHGHEEFLDDAERLVRCRVLPSQVTAPLGLEPVEDSGDDCALLDERTVGAYGGMHGHPHGVKKPTTDITAADLHTLCEIYEGVVRENADGVWVDFAFERESPAAAVRVTHSEREEITVIPSNRCPLFVRVPPRVDRTSVRATVDNTERSPGWTAGHAALGIVPAGSAVRVNYPTPAQTEHETVEGVDYAIRWQGHDIIGIHPNTATRPFYPSLTPEQTGRRKGT